jgi:hypothetical protein
VWKFVSAGDFLGGHFAAVLWKKIQETVMDCGSATTTSYRATALRGEKQAIFFLLEPQ